MISNPKTLAATTVTLAFWFLFSGPLAAQSMRFECDTEQLLEEGACVLSLFDIDVIVSSSGVSSINTVSIRLRGADTRATDAADGIIYRAEIADINADGRPEVYAYVSSAGSGSYGSLFAYVIEEDMTMSPVTLPDLTDYAQASDGYMGHDEFSVVASSLVRRFPLYQAGDVNAEPSGGTRNVVYKLRKSNAQWALKPTRIDDY
jgi:hypothetical protein